MGTYTCRPFEPLVFTSGFISELLERVAHDQRALAHLIERRALAGIEIEVHVVRSIHVVAPRVPLVEIDAAEIDDPHQRRHVVDDRKVDDVARVVVDPAGTDPRRPWRRARAS